MKIADRWLNYGEAFVRLFYPAHCGACGIFLELDETGVCSGCKSRVEELNYSPSEAILDESFEAIDDAWGLFPYESPVKELIAAVKFMKKRWLIRTFDGALKKMADVVTSEVRYDALVPIPISFQNLITREFNQAELIASRFSRASHEAVPVRTNLLKKRFHTCAQSQLTRAEREANPIGVFDVKNRHQIKDGSFLLIDDVITTGTTADEAARTLKRCGAKRVDLLALTRTPRTQ